jgi:hypothetical protein
MSLLPFERRQAQAILEAYAPPRAQGDGEPSDVDDDGNPASGDALKESGERAVRVLSPRVGEVDYLRSVLRMMRASTGMARLGIHLGLFIAMWAPLWMCGRLRTMAGTAMHERSEIIGKLLRHRVFFVRELMLLLKIGASMALLGTPSVRARSRYDRRRDPQPETRREGPRMLPVLGARRSPTEKVA